MRLRTVPNSEVAYVLNALATGATKAERWRQAGLWPTSLVLAGGRASGDPGLSHAAISPPVLRAQARRSERPRSSPRASQVPLGSQPHDVAVLLAKRPDPPRLTRSQQNQNGRDVRLPHSPQRPHARLGHPRAAIRRPTPGIRNRRFGSGSALRDLGLRSARCGHWYLVQKWTFERHSAFHYRGLRLVRVARAP